LQSVGSVYGQKSSPTSGSFSYSLTNLHARRTGISVGTNRLFDIFVYDSLEKLQYRGSALSDVVADNTVHVFITVIRVTGNAVINGAIQESGSTNLETGLVAYWSFDSFSGNTYYDVSGHGHDAASAGLGLAQGVKTDLSQEYTWTAIWKALCLIPEVTRLRPSMRVLDVKGFRTERYGRLSMEE
jgi:hypothetical protein